jgi:Multiprotein bridging factor 1
MSGVGPITQDWEPVVIRKKAPNAAARKDEKAVNAARRAGADIEAVKKRMDLVPLQYLPSNLIIVLFLTNDRNISPASQN